MGGGRPERQNNNLTMATREAKVQQRDNETKIEGDVGNLTPDADGAVGFQRRGLDVGENSLRVGAGRGPLFCFNFWPVSSATRWLRRATNERCRNALVTRFLSLLLRASLAVCWCRPGWCRAACRRSPSDSGQVGTRSVRCRP